MHETPINTNMQPTLSVIREYVNPSFCGFSPWRLLGICSCWLSGLAPLVWDSVRWGSAPLPVVGILIRVASDLKGQKIPE